MEKKFFGEIVLDIDEEIKNYGNLLCYVAGPGGGKSSWVTEKLIKKGKVLYITSRIAKVLEDEKNSVFKNDINATYPVVTNSKLCSHICEITTFDDIQENRKSIDKFIDRFDYIVIDEVHSLASDSTYQNSVFMVQKFIEYAGFEKGKTIIAMSATIEPIENYINCCKNNNKKWKIRDFTDKCHFVLPKNVWIYEKKKRETLIDSCANKGTKFVYFCNTVKEIKDTIYTECLNAKVPEENIAVILSDEKQVEFNKKYPNSKKYNKDCWDYLLKNSSLPDNVKILLTTSKLKEGININNEDINVVFCESHYVPDIIQYMGRLRKKPFVFYVVSDSSYFCEEVSEIEYNFLKSGEMLNACNEYFKKMENKEDKEIFIDYILKKFNYIAFNYFTNTFDLYLSKYSTLKAQSKSQKTWRSDLNNFFAIHPETNFLDMEKEYKNKERKDSLQYIYNNLDKPFYEDDKYFLFENIRNAFEIEGKTKASLNSKLKDKKYIIVNAERKQNKRGIKLIKLE